MKRQRKPPIFVRQPCVRAFNLAARRKMESSSSRFGADFEGVRGGGGGGEGDPLAASYRSRGKGWRTIALSSPLEIVTV